MQSLPDIPPERRAEAAQRYLARATTDFDEAERESIATQVLALLDDPRFAALFAPGSRAEVPIVGRVGDGRSRHRRGRPAGGHADAVLIADYKTNRAAPRSLRNAAARGYIAQLALYRAVLAQLYPGRPVRAALVWTDMPDLDGNSAAEALDAALRALTSA